MRLFIAESNTSFGQVIGGHFDTHFVAGQYLDVVHTHLAGDVRDDLVTVLEFDTELRVGECLDDNAVLFDC